MANTFNAGVYKEEYEAKLQERLDKPTCWKDICDVKYTDSQIINWPYMSTEFAVQTGTRGTAYGFSDFTLTNDTVTINTKKLVPVYVDFADWYQCQYVGQMEIAERQGSLISETIEAAFLGTHASWTNFGDLGGGALGLGTTQITVSTSNIDDIISGVRREVITANGLNLMNRYGLAIVWRAADQEKLEKWAQANGFTVADNALRDGLLGQTGFYLNGAYHYVSNSHTANHVFAGVRKIVRLGILRSTYGRLFYKEEPANTDGQLSGVSITSRADYGFQVPAGLATVVYDVNVA
jgi:hypothetical protein